MENRKHVGQLNAEHHGIEEIQNMKSWPWELNSSCAQPNYLAVSWLSRDIAGADPHAAVGEGTQHAEPLQAAVRDAPRPHQRRQRQRRGEYFRFQGRALETGGFADACKFGQIGFRWVCYHQRRQRQRCREVFFFVFFLLLFFGFFLWCYITFLCM